MVPLLDFGRRNDPFRGRFLREEFAFSSTSSVSARYGDFLFWEPIPALAGEPLGRVTGLEGEELKNVQAALTLPPG
jgi:hypothetical protein